MKNSKVYVNTTSKNRQAQKLLDLPVFWRWMVIENLRVLKLYLKSVFITPDDGFGVFD